MEKTISTIDGEKKFVMEVTDDELDKGDYSISNGFWVTHENGMHQIYR